MLRYVYTYVSTFNKSMFYRLVLHENCMCIWLWYISVTNSIPLLLVILQTAKLFFSSIKEICRKECFLLPPFFKIDFCFYLLLLLLYLLFSMFLLLISFINHSSIRSGYPVSIYASFIFWLNIQIYMYTHAYK